MNIDVTDLQKFIAMETEIADSLEVVMVLKRLNAMVEYAIDAYDAGQTIGRAKK